MGNSIFYEIEKQKQENYKNAREDMCKAINSLKKLDLQQKQNLFNELIKIHEFEKFVNHVNKM